MARKVPTQITIDENMLNDHLVSVKLTNVKYLYMLYSRINVSDVLSDCTITPLLGVIGPVHSDAISTPRRAYSPAAQELTTVHRDSITVQVPIFTHV